MNIQCGFPHIQQRVLENLNSHVFVLEIQNLFAIGSLKAPGPDGMLANFFQHAWDICGRDLVCLLQYCFNCGNIPEGLNNTLISLIPKVDKPSSMKQLRPVSLCNTIYRVISKIIVSRLRPLMNKLVSPTQVSFVLGRQIVENIIISTTINIQKDNA